MWNKLVHDRGGLALHAGCKVIPTPTRRPGRPDRRPVGHRQDDDDVHAPERLAAGAGRLRRLVAGRHGVARPRPAASPRPTRSARRTSRPSTARSPSRARTSRTSARTTPATSTSSTRATPRTAAPSSRSRTSRRPTRRRSSRPHFLLILNRNENVIPAVAQARGPAGGGVLHARRDHRHGGRRQGRGGQVPARPRHEPVLPDAPRPAGQPLPGAAGDEPDRGLHHEHRPRRRHGVGGARRRCASPTPRRSSRRIAEGTIEWETDPDFGYQVAARVPGIDESDLDLLQPRRLYEATGRGRRVRASA